MGGCKIGNGQVNRLVLRQETVLHMNNNRKIHRPIQPNEGLIQSGAASLHKTVSLTKSLFATIRVVIVGRDFTHQVLTWNLFKLEMSYVAVYFVSASVFTIIQYLFCFLISSYSISTVQITVESGEAVLFFLLLWKYLIGNKPGSDSDLELF